MATSPSPVVLNENSWSSCGGNWSSFNIKIGMPSQDVAVTPGTSTQYILLPQKDSSTATSSTSQCAEQLIVRDGDGNRGFEVNSSSSWVSTGEYVYEAASSLVDIDTFFGDDVFAKFDEERNVSLAHATLGVTVAKSVALGILGLDASPIYFEGSSRPEPSFMQSLKGANHIPSLAYGYTAGASYLTPAVSSQLILGGYDDSRWAANEGLEAFKFPFGSDESRPLEVALQDVTSTNTPYGPRSFMTDSIFAVIDTSLPYIWLPPETCEGIADTFNLTYDETSDLYILSLEARSKLKKLNPVLTFKLGPSHDSAENLSIDIPYAAMDLQIKYPYYDRDISYFPIRRANDSSRYIIGRAFLQEAYLVADYERRKFWISQLDFSKKAGTSITAIVPDKTLELTTKPPLSSSSEASGSTEPPVPPSFIVSTPIKIGVALVAASFVLFASFSTLWILRRRKRSQQVPQANVEKALPELPHEMSSTLTCARSTCAEIHTEHMVRELYSNERSFRRDASHVDVRTIEGLFEVRTESSCGYSTPVKEREETSPQSGQLASTMPVGFF